MNTYLYTYIYVSKPFRLRYLANYKQFVLVLLILGMFISQGSPFVLNKPIVVVGFYEKHVFWININF